MTDNELSQLFRAARTRTNDTSRVEFGFETRLLARIRAERDKPWSEWAWRLSPVFASVVAASAWWAFATENELRLDAAAAQSADDVALVESITGKTI